MIINVNVNVHVHLHPDPTVTAALTALETAITKQGDLMALTKAEIETKLAEISALLTSTASTLSTTVTAAAAGLAADIAALKAQIEAGGSVDVGAALEGLLAQATSLQGSTATIAQNLAALDAQTPPATEGTGGTGTGEGTGTPGGGENSGGPGSEP